MPFSESRSPMVGMISGGISRLASFTVEGWGVFTVKTVNTTLPSGVTAPSLIRLPFSSNTARIAGGAFSKRGVQAQISQKGFRNDPPNAPWKKLPATGKRSAYGYRAVQLM